MNPVEMTRLGTKEDPIAIYSLVCPVLLIWPFAPYYMICGLALSERRRMSSRAQADTAAKVRGVWEDFQVHLPPRMQTGRFLGLPPKVLCFSHGDRLVSRNARS